MTEPDRTTSDGDTAEWENAEPASASEWSEFPDAVSADSSDDAADVMRLNDLGAAARIKARNGDVLRYVAARREFIAYSAGTGTWESDQAAVRRFAHDAARELYARAMDESDKEMRALLSRYALKSMNHRKIEDALEVLATLKGIAIEPSILDANVGELVVGNGVVNLKTDELRPWRREDFATKRTPVCYSPGATAPRWLKFLDEIFCGDADLVAFIRRAIGYTLTGETTEHAVFILHGDGENGKSVFTATLRHVLADYAVNVEFATFAATRDDGGRARPDVVRLAGARLVTANEGSRELRLDEGLVKSLTGGDKKTARNLYKGDIEFDPRFRAWLATNHLPKIAGRDRGIWRRIRRVPFNASFPASQREEGLAQRLRSEAEGILAWAVAGAQLWYEDGLGSCAAVDAATQEYKAGQDVLAAFLADRCVVAADAEAGGGELYKSFAEWAKDNGEVNERGRVPSNRTFVQMLEGSGFKVTRARDGARWKGLEVKAGNLFDGPDGCPL
jgi:putative DNA primase/helicase